MKGIADHSLQGSQTSNIQKLLCAMKNPILIAEDDVHTSSLLMRYFSKEGFETLAAFNGEEALKIAQNRHPCFVILDLMMPGIDGWEVCGQLRTASDVPILILSARQEEADRILGLNLGADDYVVKPFSPREVVARVLDELCRPCIHPCRDFGRVEYRRSVRR